ncbi:MAG: cell division protein FtsL [Eggerthellaceae bacterium]|jgi:cell division protein FtsL
MAQTARAYQYGSTAPEPRHEQTVRVIRGRRHQVETLDGRLIAFAKIGLAVLLAFAVLGCVRVGLTSLAVSSSIATSQIESNIDTAKAEGTALEVEQSKLTNPSAVKKAAAKMGMTTPVSTETLKLSADVVATDDEGNLSLSKSLAVAAKE